MEFKYKFSKIYRQNKKSRRKKTKIFRSLSNVKWNEISYKKSINETSRRTYEKIFKRNFEEKIIKKINKNKKSKKYSYRKI